MAAQGVVATHQVAQPLPTNFDQLRVGLGEDRKLARRAAQGGRLAERLPGTELGRPLRIENGLHVLQVDPLLAVLATASDARIEGIGLRIAHLGPGVVPKLG